MIYRFTAKLVGSGETIEVQIQAPPDTPIDEMCEAFAVPFLKRALKSTRSNISAQLNQALTGFSYHFTGMNRLQASQRTTRAPLKRAAKNLHSTFARSMRCLDWLRRPQTKSLWSSPGSLSERAENH